MGTVYKVRVSDAAKVLIGLKKQAIVEDAVKRAEAAAKDRNLLVVMQVRDLPLCLFIQTKHREIDIVTNEEAEQSGVKNLQDIRLIEGS